jgi:hypothetical protein
VPDALAKKLFISVQQFNEIMGGREPAENQLIIKNNIDFVLDLLSVNSKIGFRIRSAVLFPKSNTLRYLIGVLLRCHILVVLMALPVAASPPLASPRDHDCARVSAKRNKEVVDRHNSSSLYRF